MIMYGSYVRTYGGYGDIWDDIGGVIKTGVDIANKIIKAPTATPAGPPATVPVVTTQQGMVSVPFLGNMNATTLMLGIGAIGAAWIFLSKKGRR